MADPPVATVAEQMLRASPSLSLQKLNDESIMRSLLEIKTPVRSAARSYILASPDSSNVGILEVGTRLQACALPLASPLIGRAVSRATGFG